MMKSGFAFLGLGILIFIIGVFLMMGVLIGVPQLAMVAWIPMSIGGILIVVGIVLIIILRR